MTAKSQTDKMIDVSYGEHTRGNAGWASYYRCNDHLQKVEREVWGLKKMLVRFTDLVAGSEALTLLEPEGDVVLYARDTLRKIQLDRHAHVIQAVRDEFREPGDVT